MTDFSSTPSPPRFCLDLFNCAVSKQISADAAYSPILFVEVAFSCMATSTSESMKTDSFFGFILVFISWLKSVCTDCEHRIVEYWRCVHKQWTRLSKRNWFWMTRQQKYWLASSLKRFSSTRTFEVGKVSWSVLWGLAATERRCILENGQIFRRTSRYSPMLTTWTSADSGKPRMIPGGIIEGMIRRAIQETRPL